MAAQVLCSRCRSRPPIKGRRLCDRCLEQGREWQQQRRARLKRRNLCLGCRERPPISGRARCATCLQKNRAYTSDYRARNLDDINATKRRRYEVLRNEIHTHYGGQCACCGEREPVFLAIDHIDGIVHEGPRKMRGLELYRWLRKNKFPDGYRLLCHNCNAAVRWGRQCPHESYED